MKSAEPYRPVYHFTPQSGWMNDPNGLVFFQGEYHLFFQHNPKSADLGPMHWGHAVSQDLVSWAELPVALAPDSLGRIFSGSAVVDFRNTSGLFGTSEGGLVAVYTNSLNRQQQSIAVSRDNGRTWEKFAGNPVIKNANARSGLPADFRDPSVRWSEEAGKWIMALAVKDHIQFWSSFDLKDWKKESEFGQNLGNHGGVWECPDLFSLPDGQGGSKWVLLVSINPGGPNGGSATQYFVGDLNLEGGVFRFQAAEGPVRWLDGGTDNYAGILWNNLGSRRLYVGWMGNWDYARLAPTNPWRGAMTLPRDLRLEKIGNDWLLASLPAQEYLDLPRKVLMSEELLVPGIEKKLGPDLAVSRVSLRIKEFGKDPITLVLTTGSGKSLRIGYVPSTSTLFLDRSDFVLPVLGDKYAPRMEMKMLSEPEALEWEIWLDRASAEVFVNRGLYALTGIFFGDPLTSLRLEGAEGKVSVLGIQP